MAKLRRKKITHGAFGSDGKPLQIKISSCVLIDIKPTDFSVADPIIWAPTPNERKIQFIDLIA